MTRNGEAGEGHSNIDSQMICPDPEVPNAGPNAANAAALLPNDLDHGLDTVRSLADANNWPAHHLNQVLQHDIDRKSKRKAMVSSLSQASTVAPCSSDEDDDESADESAESRSLRRLIDKAQDLTMSTAFSGLDTPGTAFEQQRAEVNHRAKKAAASSKRRPARLRKCRHLSAVEYEGHCQRELKSHPCAPMHLFCNILMFLHESVRVLAGRLQDTSRIVEVLDPLIRTSLQKVILTTLDCAFTC